MKLSIIEVPCQTPAAMICYTIQYTVLHHTLATGKLFSGILAFVCVCARTRVHTHTRTHSLSEENQILNSICTYFYCIPFIATFKGHGHTSEIFLEFHFSLTLVKHILCVCLPEIFIVAFLFFMVPKLFCGILSLFFTSFFYFKIAVL